MTPEIRNIVICFGITIALFVYMISDKLNDPRLVTMLIIMPIFIVVVLFAVFGKDLFRKSDNKKPKTEKVE